MIEPLLKDSAKCEQIGLGGQKFVQPERLLRGHVRKGSEPLELLRLVRLKIARTCLQSDGP